MLTAELALKKYILEYADKQGWYGGSPLETGAQIDESYAEMICQISCDATQDVLYGQFKTELPTDKHWNRHCEVEMVAVKDNSGNYIGFPRFFGGGKHFDESEYYDYAISHAEYLDCKEEQQLVTVRTFSPKA